MSGSKLNTVSITFSSKVSIKLRDNFFTVEACEQRAVPEGVTDIDWDAERKLLWDTVNGEVDEQIQELKDFFANIDKKPL